MRKLSFIIGTAAAVVAAVAVAPSQATFRGTNGLLVYQKQVGQGANNVQLFTIRPDDTGETQITHFKGSAATSANFSADGQKIVFTRVWNPGGNNEALEIYTMSADGTRLKALPRPGKFTIEPNWTPDGKRIVFLQGPTNSIAMINANGSGLRNPVVPGHGGDSVCVFPRRQARCLPALADPEERRSRGDLRRTPRWQDPEAHYALGWLRRQNRLFSRRHACRVQRSELRRRCVERVHDQG